MLKKKRIKKIITLVATAALLVGAIVPAAAFADTVEDEGYAYKYIGTDSNNKGGSVSYYDTESKRTSSSSTVMFKLKKDSSNKVDLAYCCDLDTYTVNNTYYKRTNLENAGYFESDVAGSIRNVVVNGYDPANADSINELKTAVNKWAEENGKKDRVNNLSRDNAVTATQLAIWSLSNPEMKPSSSSSTVTLVKDYLVSLPERALSSDEIVAESLGITATIDKDWENNTAVISGTFNFYSEPDAGRTKVCPEGNDITLIISVGGATILEGNVQDLIKEGTVKFDFAALDYDFEIELADAGALTGEVDVDIAISGTQELPRGAYFYKTPDRSDSQNFVGIADWDKQLALKGKTTVLVEEPAAPSEPETPEVPEEPIGPTEPETPVVPDAPEAPMTPEEPTAPEMPEEPMMPEEPIAPSVPEIPETPVAPEEPTAPEMPEEPTAPEMPTDPEEPDLSDDPEDPCDPNCPEYPSTPKTGDDSSMLLWAMIAGTSLAIVGVMMALQRRRV